MNDQPDPREKPENDEMRTAAVVGQFLKEVLILVLGVALGFFWYMYYSFDKTLDVHIIIFLLVIIICMARYIVLFKRNRPSD